MPNSSSSYSPDQQPTKIMKYATIIRNLLRDSTIQLLDVRLRDDFDLRILTK